MSWFLVLAISTSTIAIGFVLWRKWITPWGEIETLVRQIDRGERPPTFVVAGNAAARRIGVVLENLFLRRSELDKQIAKRESGTQAIFSAMQDGLLVVDSNQRCVLANATFSRLFGQKDIPRGTPLLEVVRDPAIERLITEMLRAAEPLRDELKIADLQFELNAVPTRNDAGEIRGAVVLFHDITRLKRADQIRSDFVANVSHELRTPLSILRGYIETLLDSPDTSRDERKRILEVMERHSNRLELLVEDLLVLAQLESAIPNVHWGDVDLSTLFREIVADWEKKIARKKMKLVVDVPASLPIIRADEARLHEILYNLLDNAVKYSQDNGEIRLTAERNAAEVTLSVIDNGVGIGKEDLPRVFERFYRADKARSRELGGTGLGLSIVKHIAQLHGGRVEAQSDLGRGTTIRVVLPVVTET